MTCKIRCGACLRPLTSRTAKCPNGCDVREKMSAARAAMILAEYPDADLSAFDIEGDVEAIAIEAAAKSLAAIARKMPPR